MVTIGVAFVLFVAPVVLDMSKTVTRVETNVKHMMEEFSIKPLK
jgi:hypothetical protein